MSLISAAIGISTLCSPAVATRSSPTSAFVSVSSASMAAREIADRHLIDWGIAARTGVNPYEFPAPSLVSVNTAVKLLTTFPMPEAPSVVPNGDGGISFEWERGEMLVGIEIDREGGVRQTIFQGAKLVYSQDFDASFFK